MGFESREFASPAPGMLGMINGCIWRAGDLSRSSMLLGESLEKGTSLLELSARSNKTVHLSNGQTCTGGLDEGNSIRLSGYCQQAGFRHIGFGERRGSVRAAPASGRRLV
jgi:hypothetical protein